MQPYIYYAEVVKVIDGDTITVNVDLGYDTWLYNQKVRLAGIDTPESRINLKRFPERTKEKELGLEAKELVKSLCGDKVKIISQGKGKYGRILGIVYTLDDKNINQTLIDNDLAVEYWGGTKTKVWG